MKHILTSSIRNSSREIVRELGFLENPYQSLGLSIAQVHLMLECETLGALNQNDLAKNLKVNKSYISRLVKQLVNLELVNSDKVVHDQRSQLISLTQKGQKLLEQVNQMATQQVESALTYLSDQQKDTLIEGLNCYAKALKRARLLRDVTLRKIEPKDNLALDTLIKHILTAFGANKPGFAYADRELTSMFESYQSDNKIYYIAEKEGKLLGGSGFGPLEGAPHIAELKKMYLSTEARGLGLGDELLKILINEAKKCGYQQLYLETLSTMTAAIALYQKYGFKILEAPLGESGHFGCNVWMVKNFL